MMYQLSTLTSDLILGVIAGVLASVLIYSFSIFLNKIIIPNLRSHLYQGPDISGHWETYDSIDENSKPVGFVEITQKGEKISLIHNRHTSKSGRTINRQFEYKGGFVSGQLTLLGEDSNMKGYIRSAMVFQLSSNNKIFSGKSLYIEHETGKAIADDYWMKRGA